MAFPIALGLAAAHGIYQGIKGIRQKNQAKKLKESTFIPEELLMNRELAKQQAFSRRAPGQSNAEENTRRTMANQISAGQRMAGGDVNKLAAITAAAGGQANDANARLAAQGQQFSENAFGRLSNANMGIAEQKRQNRSEYLQTKNALQAAGDQNIFSGIGNIASAGLAGIESGAFDGIGKAGRASIREGRVMTSKLNPNNSKLTKEWYKQGQDKIAAGRLARKTLAKEQRGGWNDLMRQRGAVAGSIIGYDSNGNPVYRN